MADTGPTKAQLREENQRLRRRIIELEGAPSRRRPQPGTSPRGEQFLEIITSFSPDMIYKLDPEGRIEFISDAVRHLGYEPTELLGQPFEVLVHPEDRAKARPRYRERRTGRRATKSFEIRLLSKPGRVRNFDVNSVAVVLEARGLWDVPDDQIKRPDKRFLGTLGIGRDITLRKRREQARLAAQRELELHRARSIRSDRLRTLGQMAAGIAHELNQPLVGVRGLAEHLLIAMQRGWELTDEKVQARIGGIIEQADRMAYIIQHVRTFAREAGTPEVRPVNVNQVVESSMGMLGAQFRARGVIVDRELGVDLPEVMANPFSLEEVILNLLLNARDAVEQIGDERPTTSGPGIVVRTRDERIGDRRWVIIQVIDRGVGMSPEVLERVFDPFFTTKGPDHGTGLGLSVSKSIVETFGGEMGIESTPGGGTTVTVSLPANQ